MIKVLLQGGLGNQLFQYAFARTLAYRGFDVALDADYGYIKLADIQYARSNGGGERPQERLNPSSHTKENTTSCISNPHIRNLELTNFQISLPILHHECRSTLAYYDCIYHKILHRILPRNKPYARAIYSLLHTRDSKKLSQDFIAHRHFRARSYFEGFFGDLCYFAEIESILRQEFAPRHMTQATKALQDRIKRTSDSVFLHIRRGDYLRQEHWQFVKAGAAYYNGALKIITRTLERPVVFVFSDDLAWCKENLLSLLDPTLCKQVEFVFVGNGDEGRASDDLALMSSCEHAIIANSTFSFWGAYLIPNPQKVVCVPSHYLWDGTTPDCYPDSWHRLDVHWGQKV